MIRNVRKRLESILLCMAMLLTLLPTTAMAAENVLYLDKNGTKRTCDSATEVTSETTAWTAAEEQEAWYVVSSDVTFEGTDARITVTGDVHLILADGKTLTASRGIYVGSGSSLTIYGQSTGDGAGQLKAKATQLARYAGIGGNENNEAAHGNITINGGIITAESVGDAAGIGSGSGAGASDKPNGTITINGGKVTATAGGSNGAGIGGGFFNKITGGNIVINGGTVEAKGAKWAAGIGSGYSDQQESNGRSITISGGKVTANGGEWAAGVGGGYGCKEASITSITIEGDADVTANGGARGAGIGSGYGSTSKMTTPINIGGDAVVEAKGGDDKDYGGAGIGSGGASGGIGSITISGGDVTATGGTATDSDMYSGAGIGSGGNSKIVDFDGSSFVVTPGSGAITIDGGVVTATGGTDAAGIGDGEGGKGGDFATGENGQAIIYADSITDTETSDWNGIIFQGDEGKVYGEVSLNENLTLTNGQTLNIPKDSSLTVPEGKELDASSQGLTNAGTLTILGTVNGTITGDGAVIRDSEGTDSVASYNELYYSTLEAAINAANGAASGGTVTLLEDATLSTPLDEDVTLSVSSAVLTVGTDGLTNLANGTLEIKQGGGLKLDTNTLVGTGGALNLTKGSVTMKGDTVTLTENSVAEIPSGKTFYLMLGTKGPALNAVIAENAKLTVNGTLKAVSGTGTTGGSQVTVKGTLDVKGNLTIALQADVTVESGGTLNLPAMTKETMGNTADGWGMKGDIIVNSGANLTYASNDVLGGDNPLMTLTSGTATLNLGNANATKPSVSLTLNGKASVDGRTKALLLASDGGGTIIPIAISVAGTSEATVSENGVLNLVNGSSLTVADDATFTVAQGGILEVHSTASFASKATVSGKVYVFETADSTNPISGANITLTSTGAVYAEKTELTGTNIAPAQMAASTEEYTSTSSGVGEKTFAKQWTYNGGSSSSGGSSSTYYSSTVEKTENGTVTVSPKNASKNTTVTITVTPDDGYELDTLTVTDKDGKAVELTKVSDTKYTFKMPASKVTVKAAFQEIAAEPATPFTDVFASDYYYDAVLWAVENGITNGTSATTFSPDATVTRAQMVTFLWRAHGAPKAAGSNPFTDVSADAYYYDAVLWAVSNGVTNGTSATTFSPDAPVTRAQAVTFQWRTAGAPAVSGNSFDDVAADAYYAGAVAWAVANEITNGTSATTFSPDSAVSRAQAVTFLYRELV